MHFCPHCGIELPDIEARFCPSCGGSLAEVAVAEVAGPQVSPSLAAPIGAQAPQSERLPRWLWVGAATIVFILLCVGAIAWNAIMTSQRQAQEAARLAQAKVTTVSAATVPDVKGLTALQATDRIKAAGLVLGKVDYDPNAAGAVGAVVGVAPAAGSRSSKGAMVVITVVGAEPIVVPQFVGLTQGGAKAAAAALRLNVVATGQASKAKSGSVVSQFPASGSNVAPGSSVNIGISMGPANVASSNSDGTTTPKKGSAERTAIMDACRIYFGYNGKFIVNELEVRGTRAFANVTPDDNRSYGSTGVYLMKNGSGWVVSTDSRTSAERGTFVSEENWLSNN